ncbi:hypothetical protein ACLBWT_18920 [Paenibacillus sp. D51F]
MRKYELMDNSVLMTNGQGLWLKRVGRDPEAVTSEDIFPNVLELLEAQRLTKIGQMQMELAHALDESIKLGAKEEAKTILDAYRPILEEPDAKQVCPLSPR